MTRRTARFLIPFVAVLTGSWAVAAADPPQRFILVEGTGSVEAKPDTATIDTGVQTRADTARKAVETNNVAMHNLLAAIEKAGIAADDIRTSNFSVSPWFEPYVRNQPRRIGGYQAANRVSVRIREIARLGDILDAVVRAGSNQVSGVRFTIRNSDALKDEARRKALADARHRAELYAKAAGVSLGSVLSIEERTTALPRPVVMAADAVARSDAVPVAAGTQTVIASVMVRFALE